MHKELRLPKDAHHESANPSTECQKQEGSERSLTVANWIDSAAIHGAFLEICAATTPANIVHSIKSKGKVCRVEHDKEEIKHDWA
jgi:hypothetical protein